MKNIIITASGRSGNKNYKWLLIMLVAVILSGIKFTARAQVPPFTQESAEAKLKINQDVWNSRDREKIASLYGDSVEFRDRTNIVKGHDAIVAYLKNLFKKELDFKISKEIWGAKLAKNAIRFEEEWRDAKTGQWYHSYGVEVVLFDGKGIITERFASINDKPISASERTIN